MNSFARRAAYALGWRIRRQPLRVLALELTQFGDQRVVFGIADLRLVQHIVKMLVPPQLVAEYFDALFRFTAHRRLL